jgi:type VI secretion system secreted protein VgrG
MALSQDTRMGTFTCDLGGNVMVIERFEGGEGLSELFEFRLDVLSEDKFIDMDKILGTNCYLTLNTMHQGVKRHFNGALVEAQRLGTRLDLTSYRLVLRPWFWLLTRTSNCTLFHDRTVPDIISDVLGKHAFALFKKKLSKPYPVLEYCVQYCESDFAFVSRLMEEYGIYYFFEHTGSGHEMVLADSGSAHVAKPGGTNLKFYTSNIDQLREQDAINDLVPSRRFRSGKFSFKDYDYHVPTKSMLSEGEAGESYANSALEVYSYPGRYVEKSDGDALAKVRLEAEQALDKRVMVEGNAASCVPGFLTTVAEHPVSSLNKEYLIVRANHVYKSSNYKAGMGSSGDDYFGRYEFLPTEVPFKAPQVTAKPRILGPQTAVVVSEVDDKCRIKVKFHWQKEHGESRYVRIGHGWAGQGWGDLKIPRIEMEVIVEFLDGDPDQPLVTGTVYNGDNTTPYSLPEDKTISGTKSQTYDGPGYNEFILDDRDGSQLIRMHGEKNMETTIKNDCTEDIGNVWQVEAKTKILFKVGQSTITMTPDKIEIKSINIDILGDAMIKVEAGAMLDMESKGVGSLKAAAPQIVKGAVVLIN